MKQKHQKITASYNTRKKTMENSCAPSHTHTWMVTSI